MCELVRIEQRILGEIREAGRSRLEAELNALSDGLLSSEPSKCEGCGSRMWSCGKPSLVRVISVFGEVRFLDATVRCPKCNTRVQRVSPAVGVNGPGRIAGTLLRFAALLAVVAPYELAAKLLAELVGVELSPMSVWRCVQRLGSAVEQHTNDLDAYHKNPHVRHDQAKDAPDVVVVGVDGAALGMQVRPTRRRRVANEVLPPLPPVDEGHFREVKTGALLLPKDRMESSPGRHSVVRRLLVTCLGNADQIFDRLWSKLHEAGWLGPHTVVVVVGDGAEWIWNRAKMFPVRCEILDFWHAVEKAWDFARLHFGEGSTKAAQFAAVIAKDLKTGKVDAVAVRLERLTGTEASAEALAALIRYYQENRTRMRYDEYLRLGYGIGSGAVESAHKQVVHARMRQAGMRWSEAGARNLLALRVLLLNGAWSMLDRAVEGPRAA
jgi:hypothetical protein